MRISTARELADLLGVSKRWAQKLKRRSWFPPRGPDGWDHQEVLDAYAANVSAAKEEEPRKAPGLGAELAQDLDAKLAQLDELDDEGPDAQLCAARSVLVLACAQLAADLRGGGARASSWQAAARALAELRQAERAAHELALARKELIPRSHVAQVSSDIHRSAAQLIEGAGAGLATQVLIWFSDQGFAALNSEAQARAVRHWWKAHTDAFRRAWAEKLRAELAAVEAEKGGAA